MSKNNKELEDGKFVGNFECICGTSSDAMSVYEKSDSAVDAYCRSGFCDRDSGYIGPRELEDEGFTKNGVLQFKPINTNNYADNVDLSEITELECRGWRERKITKSVSEKYGVRCQLDEDGELVSRFYPSFKDGKLVGYKRRKLPKQFSGVGSTKSTNELFGQNEFESGQKYLVITTGEEDALAFAKVLKSEKNGATYWTPCVSITCGDDSIIKQMKANFEYINSFEKVIFAFDNDESAQPYIEPASKLLSPGKAHVVKYPNGYKDVSQMVKDGLDSDVKRMFWKAEPIDRVDVLHLNQMWEDFESEDSNAKIPFPDSWSILNEMMNGGLERGEITTIGALTSIGKGQPLWENVVTPSGYRKVGDIRVGDELVGSNGNPVEVIGVYPQGVKKVFRVEFNDGAVVHCDDSHLWKWYSEYQYREGKEGRVTNIYEMVDHMESGVTRSKVMMPRSPGVQWEEKNLEVDPWLLGVLIGDGSCFGTFGLTNSEEDIIQKVSEKLEPWCCELRYKERYNYSIVTKSDNHVINRNGQNMNPLKDTLMSLDLVSKSVDKKIPEKYMTASFDQRLELVRGLFDTDGTVDLGCSNLEFSTSSAVLAEQMVFLLRSLGCTAKLVERPSSYTKDGVKTVLENNNWRIFIKQPKGLFVFSSQKHHSRFRDAGRTYARRYVKDISYVGDEETVCFKVDAEDELYLTNDFVVTHNSSIINNIVYHWIENTPYKVGVMYLEGTRREVVRDLLSLDTSTNLRKIDRSTIDMGGLKKRFFENLVERDKFVYVDHQGSISPDDIFDKFEYLVKAESCDIIVLDPLQSALNSSDNSVVIDFMDALLKFAKQTDVAIIDVSHMRKPQSDDPHDVNEYDLLGSSAISQISFNTILISRDKMSPDPIIRNATKLQLVKCRRTGETGEAGWLRYDPDTTHMYATSDPYIHNLDESDDDFLNPDGKEEGNQEESEEQEDDLQTEQY